MGMGMGTLQYSGTMIMPFLGLFFFPLLSNMVVEYSTLLEIQEWVDSFFLSPFGST